MDSERLELYIGNHGSVRAVVEGFPKPLELKQRNTNIRDDGEVRLTLSDGETRFMADRVIAVVWGTQSSSEIGVDKLVEYSD